MDKIAELRERLVALNDGMNAIQNKADTEERDLTTEESEEIERRFGEVETVQAEIQRRERLEAVNNSLKQSAGRKTEPAPGRVHPQPRDMNAAGRGDFHNFGDYAQSVKNASIAIRSGGQVDPRLIANAAPSSAGNEGTDAEGGYAIPPDFRAPILEKVMGEGSLLSRCNQIRTARNSVQMPSDETTPWQTSGGVQAGWTDEITAITQSKPSLKQVTVSLGKLAALVPVSEELLEDAPALGSWLMSKVPQKFTSKVNSAILSGDGSGKPLGILDTSSPSVVPTIDVAAESGQTAATIVFANIVNMWARLYSESRANAVWLINQDIEPQLLSLQFPGTGTAVPVYLPPGGLSASPYGLLMGRPVVPVQACSTLGTRGDIVLADLTQYMALIKTNTIRQDVSMHFFFDADAMAFRFVMRVGGKPWWTSAITPENGSNSLSCFVTLATRS